MHNDIKPNRLINEKSPYLLQHAYNPVDWFPWGEEAFDRARAEDKPVLLSIGYSTCHWCHVMAHESFEDQEVAEAINRDFIAIKVDKEERPDIDAVYMAVCQGLTGSGGWPLTIIMTPDQKPFFAGTYFPKKRRYNIPGVLDLLDSLSEKWEKDKGQIRETANQIVETLQKRHSQQKREDIKETNENTNMLDQAKDIIFKTKENFAHHFDRAYGGFGTQPKFPSPHNLMFLLRYSKLEKDAQALNMVEKTLKQMYLGGIFDHIGFGFSRYSTDEKWLVPHFEKMLYDNALLAMTYLETYEVTGKVQYRVVAEKILEYILREMTSEEGGFYSAQDADSEGVEGKYYVFTQEEIIQLLGEEDGNAFNTYFDIRKKPNFEEGNIPNLITNASFSNEDGVVPDKIESLCQKVYDYRIKRMELHKDDKLLTSWNSLMLVAFAKAYGALGDETYLKAAQRCEEFIVEKLTNSEHDRLYVRYRDGDSAGQGTLDDYAFYIWALAVLYEVTYNEAYLKKALSFTKIMEELFWDQQVGGFYLTAKDSEGLIYRPKETYDGAIPSGNSVAGYALVKLKKLTRLDEISKICEKQLVFLERSAKDYPSGYSFTMMALMMEYYEESFLCENGVCS